MIGWEYPPHNSGGLGVACQGMTQSLAEQNTEIYFTLPYQTPVQAQHMTVLDCSDPSWSDKPGQPVQQPPFYAYDACVDFDLNQAQVGSRSVDRQDKAQFNSHQLRSLPQSDIEHKVNRYAQLVEQQAQSVIDQVDVIHAHDWMSFPAALKLKQKSKKPLITHIHSTERDRTPVGYGSPYIEATEKQAMEIADTVIAVSYYTKRLLVEAYQIDPDKIQVVHNGVSPLPYQAQRHSKHFAHQRPIVSFMGRLTNQKGANFFIEVGRRVLAQLPETLFILAGTGHLYHELLLQTAQRQLTAKVLFSGFVRGKQKRKLLETTDVFVMPSLSEPFGLVALEAAQHKIPVIVSASSGVSEILSSAIKVDFWDQEQMAQQIISLLQDNAYAERVIAGQNSELEQATWQRSAQKLRQIYQQVFFA
jgi:glycosyltransferase involved in cell wall biosynthesis